MNGCHGNHSSFLKRFPLNIPGAAAPSDSRTSLGLCFLWICFPGFSPSRVRRFLLFPEGFIFQGWLTRGRECPTDVPQMSHTQGQERGSQVTAPAARGLARPRSPFPRCFHGFCIPGHWGRTGNSTIPFQQGWECVREQHNPVPEGLGMFNKCRSTPGGIPQFPLPLEALSRHGPAWRVCHSLLHDPGLIWPKLGLIPLEKLPKPWGMELSGLGCD